MKGDWQKLLEEDQEILIVLYCTSTWLVPMSENVSLHVASYM